MEGWKSGRIIQVCDEAFVRMKQMKYSFKYMLKKNYDLTKIDVYVQFFACFFSLPLAWLIINFTSISANAITLASLFFGVSGAVLAPIFGLKWLLVGFMLFVVLDLADGRVAVARGGETGFGAFLDLVSDRCVVISATVSLACYHMMHSEPVEMFLLIVYVMSIFFMDALAYANLISSTKSGSEGPLGKSNAFIQKEVNNTFKNTILDPWHWLPGRMSSYLFIAAAAMITGSFSIAYGVGIAAVLCEYTMLGLKRFVSLARR